MEIFTLFLLLEIIFGFLASANGEANSRLTANREQSLLQAPETRLLHPNLKYLTVKMDKATGRPYFEDKSLSKTVLNRAEEALFKGSKTQDGKHPPERWFPEQTSLAKLELGYHLDYIDTNETLTYLAMQRGEFSTSQDYIVELAIVVDKEWGDAFPDDSQKMIEYWAVHFWDINMRFRTLPSTKISFRITSIIVITDFEAQPFIEEARNDEGVASISEILSKFGEWMTKNSDDFAKFDLAMCMTGTKTDGYGIAYLNAACKPNVNVMVVNSLSKYNAIDAITHEFGHNLGAPHDANENYPGGCSSDGFIMSGNVGIGRHFFSECSDRTIKAYVTSDQAECLRRIDEPMKPIFDPEESTKYTPTLNEQCKALRNDPDAYITQKESETCVKAICWSGNSGVDIWPVDNTPCRNGRCFRSRCLPDQYVMKNVQSGECILGRNIFSGNDDAVMGPCPSAPTPLETVYPNRTGNGYLLSMPYSTQEATENEDKCLQVVEGNEDIVSFARCANVGQGAHEWQIYYLEDRMYLLKNIQADKCMKQEEGSTVITVGQCNGDEGKYHWSFDSAGSVM